MAKKKATPIPPTEAPTPDCLRLEEYEYPLIVKKQVKRLLGLFNLPEDYPGRNESIIKYQESLEEKGVEKPPTNKQDAAEFYKITGEFHG